MINEEEYFDYKSVEHWNEILVDLRNSGKVSVYANLINAFDISAFGGNFLLPQPLRPAPLRSAPCVYHAGYQLLPL